MDLLQAEQKTIIIIISQNNPHHLIIITVGLIYVSAGPTARAIPAMNRRLEYPPDLTWELFFFSFSFFFDYDGT